MAALALQAAGGRELSQVGLEPRHAPQQTPAVDLEREKALADLLHAAASEQLLTSAHDLADGGLGQTLAESVLRFGLGARVVLDELEERDGVDTATALFSESTGRVIVTVRREDDVRFQGLCDGRGFPVLRIGVTDAASGSLEVQGAFEATIDELRGAHGATLPSYFGDVIKENVTEGYVGRGPLDDHGSFSPRTDS